MYPRWRGHQLQPRQGHALLGTQDSLGDLPSLLAASRELCGAVVTQKLGRTTVHAQPQASERRLDGAVPRSEVEGRISPNTGSPPPGQLFFRGRESWSLSQTPPRAAWGVTCGFSSALLRAGSRSSGVNRFQMWYHHSARLCQGGCQTLHGTVTAHHTMSAGWDEWV